MGLDRFGIRADAPPLRPFCANAVELIDLAIVRPSLGPQLMLGGLFRGTVRSDGAEATSPRRP